MNSISCRLGIIRGRGGDWAGKRRASRRGGMRLAAASCQNAAKSREIDISSNISTFMVFRVFSMVWDADANKRLCGKKR